jgi:hypothetical protein
MNDSDYVYVNKQGGLSYHAEEGFEQQKSIGRIVELRDPPGDSVVEIWPDEDNIAPFFATLGTLWQQYQYEPPPGDLSNELGGE